MISKSRFGTKMGGLPGIRTREGSLWPSLNVCTKFTKPFILIISQTARGFYHLYRIEFMVKGILKTERKRYSFNPCTK